MQCIMHYINTSTPHIHAHVQTDELAAHLGWTLRVLMVVVVVSSVFPAQGLALVAMFEWWKPREEAQMDRLQSWMNALLPRWICIKTEGAHCNQV
jgi:hypothetical protein